MFIHENAWLHVHHALELRVDVIAVATDVEGNLPDKLIELCGRVRQRPERQRRATLHDDTMEQTCSENDMLAFDMLITTFI